MMKFLILSHMIWVILYTFMLNFIFFTIEKHETKLAAVFQSTMSFQIMFEKLFKTVKWLSVTTIWRTPIINHVIES